MAIIAKLILEILPRDEKITVIDCGAKGGEEGARWSFLGDRLVLFGFDPEEDECTRLNTSAEAQGLHHYYYPYCLAKDDQKKWKFLYDKAGILPFSL